MHEPCHAHFKYASQEKKGKRLDGLEGSTVRCLSLHVMSSRRTLCTAYAKTSQDMLQRVVQALPGWTEQVLNRILNLIPFIHPSPCDDIPLGKSVHCASLKA